MIFVVLSDRIPFGSIARNIRISLAYRKGERQVFIDGVMSLRQSLKGNDDAIRLRFNLGITLSVLTGATAGRKLRLATGQTARFGKTEWADYAFPDDGSMSDVHFAIECTHGKCLLRDQGSESGTFVDGKQIAEFQLHTGDEFTAGKTVFSVAIDGESPRVRTVTTPVANIAVTNHSSSTKSATMSLTELCEFIKLDEFAQALAKDQKFTPTEFVRVLANERQFMSALRLTAHQFAPREAVWWGSLCTRKSVGSLLSAADIAALDAAENWVKTGEESDRRKAHAAAEETKMETAAGWVALAAFWAEGSLTPIGIADVACDERLTGQAVAGALLMAAVQVNPKQAEANYKQYLVMAQDILNGTFPVPGAGGTSVKD